MDLIEKRYTETLKEVLDRVRKVQNLASQEEALKELYACRTLMFETISRANAVPSGVEGSHSISVPRVYSELIDKLDAMIVSLGGWSSKGIQVKDDGSPA